VTHRLGSLFSGSGAFEMGFEDTGAFVTAFQVEWDEYARAVLRKNFPHVEVLTNDVRTANGRNLPECDVLIGGFPCQDVSNAGKQLGLAGERSGLWFEFARLIFECRPRLVVIENVGALTVRGLDVVLSDLAALGFDAEWDCVPASAVGAYHERDRVFILAYPAGIYGNARGVLEAGREGRAQLELGRLRGLGVATRGALPHARLESEPRLDRLVHRTPNRSHRLRLAGNAVDRRVARYLADRILASGVLELAAGMEVAA
jgi:DNA (cytosine-5)-methyltransferase 1